MKTNKTKTIAALGLAGLLGLASCATVPKSEVKPTQLENSINKTENYANEPAYFVMGSDNNFYEMTPKDGQYLNMIAIMEIAKLGKRGHKLGNIAEEIENMEGKLAVKADYDKNLKLTFEELNNLSKELKEEAKKYAKQ